ncbi:MAG: serine hydrolase domain-containing protein [Myxococcota bacterium]|nr:serine hydrolase domain-containing protein [Myxococcota bacterium]
MSDEIDVHPLRDGARREIDAGLRACQLAVGRDGAIVWTESFGSADPETRFGVASATKPIVASAVWLLIGDGLLDIGRPVADYLPEFGANGKRAVTVEQVLLMTCGFPSAPMSPAEGANAERRIARLATWELEYEPGTKYVYHGSSAHWVLAELIERLGGLDFRDFVEQHVTRPLGLPRVLGIPRSEQTNIAQLSGKPSRDLQFDYADVIEAGMPGGGGVMTAATLARFYQALLHNPRGLWKSEVLEDATTKIRCTLPDPLMQLPANRTLGVVIGAGFGTTWGKSPTAFGWPGAGGQIGFAEPATGLSFSFLQTGDPDQTSQFTRAIKLSNLALELGA